MSVFRLYVEKKQAYAVEANAVLGDLKSALSLPGLTGLRLFNRYDVERITAQDFAAAESTVFSEPQVDLLYHQLPSHEGAVFAVELLPGQYDQRADSAAQCVSILTQKEPPLVACAKVYLLEGTLSPEEVAAIKSYLINPVESREASLDTPATLEQSYPVPADVAILEGFTTLDEAGLREFISDYGLAMDLEDISFCQQYFAREQRDPTITEIRMIDTYWSDHCRHTTFMTHIEHVEIEREDVKASYDKYLHLKAKLGRSNRPVTLMEIATIGARALKADGKLTTLDESEEVNACSVHITVDVDGVEQDWLLMFKNETHNHPTEIEPFGGAATCLGGAIRDPLSGRSYVYQAMRVTGAADPLTPVSQTLKGKLPQRKITTTAAAGYSSYGNQIGLTTGLVSEIYHPGYAAKRMEVGAVIAAAPSSNVVRETPASGDVVILLGGKTGRDGCGGATGSSKSHTTESLTTCGAEVQKGNAPEERKIQRLFRNPEVTRMIKRCNDFGAGGVSVAIGELADSLIIDLDRVPKKYEGLDGTELAISESQERMAVVVAADHAERFHTLAAEENLESTAVATVTDSGRLVMTWRGKTIVDLDRGFLNTSGAPKKADVAVSPAYHRCSTLEHLPFEARLKKTLSDLNVCSQKGLVERFDSSIGTGTVLTPFGGLYQSTPIQTMAAKIPLISGETDTASLMSYGFDPYTSELSPYDGAMLAVCQSVAKLVAAGGSRKRCWLSFQEYFQRLAGKAENWGKPFSALLGALEAQLTLECAAIGGKDSMSGSFEDLHVPPTLISFAVSTTKASQIISPEFKAAGSVVAFIAPTAKPDGSFDLAEAKEVIDRVEALIAAGKVRSAWVTSFGGVAEGLFKMSIGNRLGVKLSGDLHEDFYFAHTPCGFILECDTLPEGCIELGYTTEEFTIEYQGKAVDCHQLLMGYESKLEGIFPTQLPTPKIALPTYSYQMTEPRPSPAIKVAKPRILLPAFAGTNCEYDTARAFEKAGGITNTFIVRNRSAADIIWSVDEFEKLIRSSNIIAIPGGFSGGDEPDGSGKFITAFFRNPRITEAVYDLLYNRDGLMIGICNGFQALIKLGLVPYGRIIEPTESSPTLTFNRMPRHQSKLVYTRVASNKSPWMMYTEVGDIHNLAVSHGEGRFVADGELIAQLAAKGQITTQYVDLGGNPTLDTTFNPNFSVDAIEGITSPDGRIFGKMAHSERVGTDIHKNAPGNKDQQIFRGAVDYFTK